ncbi:MAG: bifunctional serine/threonine-protein kinase/formylglycine-generating enzyme family protein [Planctomycetota bacterium]
MRDPQAWGELLLADLALVTGVAEARDVALALQRYWERREHGASLTEELGRIAGLDEEVLKGLEAEVARCVAEAGGDARRALVRRRGLDRSLRVALAAEDPRLSRSLTHLGVGARAPLRVTSTDRYLDFDVVGEGGMGVVYAAVDTELNREVAFKTIRPPAGVGNAPATTPIEASPPPPGTEAARTFATLRARFLQEAWITAGLEHPGVVPVYELARTPEGVPFYTMRLLRGRRTLATAIEEVRTAPIEERLALLEPFLKLCDAVAFAHARGVIHRDLKPENVVLGGFGEVVLLDWGLARLEEDEDLAASRWQEQVQALRQAGDLRTLAGGLGTPGYMAPESTQGRPDALDARSDVWSLGAILFEILTGRLPFPRTTYAEYVTAVTTTEAPRACTVAPDVPGPLEDLCARALAREPAARLGSAGALARAIRTWEGPQARDREVEALLDEAGRAVEEAATQRGRERLAGADRALATLARAATLAPERSDLEATRQRADALREAGIRERERRRHRRLLARAAVLVGAALAIVALLAIRSIRQETVRTQEARATRLRLADVRTARNLVEEASHLWPIEASIAPRMKRWLEQASPLLARRPLHERTLRRLDRSDPAEDGEGGPSPWIRRQLRSLIADLDVLQNPADPERGLLPDVRHRYRLARTRRERSIEAHAAAWEETRQDVAASPRYGGLRIVPQEGLVPLGADPGSGLFEFACLDSGTLPQRDPRTGHLELAEDFALVLVLLPGGTYWMGAQNEDPRARNYIKQEPELWLPVHEETVGPFFLSKYECTRAQCETLRFGRRPPLLGHTRERWADPRSRRNPETALPWPEWTRWLERHGLRLPTEREWEYACRAGTETPTWCQAQGIPLAAGAWYAGNSDRAYHPVGGRLPNPFGLFDILGNAWELCLDLNCGQELPVGIPAYQWAGPAFVIERGGRAQRGQSVCNAAARGAPAIGGYRGCRPARDLRDG